jgi:hypothetical protein
MGKSPGATKEQADWFNELQRITVSGEVAARIYETHGMRPASPSRPGAAWRPASRALDS